MPEKFNLYFDDTNNYNQMYINNLTLNEMSLDEEKMCDNNKTEISCFCDSTKTYLNEISFINILSPEEEKIIFIRYNNGDYSVKNKLINSNLKLVVSIAKKYYLNTLISSSIDFLDLVQAGNEGLIKAIDKYDVFTGNKFSTYATYWIMQSILRFIFIENRSIKIPRDLKIKINALKKYKNDYIKINGKEPSILEYALNFNMTEKQIYDLLLFDYEVISLDEVINEASDVRLKTYSHYISDNTNFENDVEIKLGIEHILKIARNILTEKQYGVLLYRTGLQTGKVETLKEVSQIFGITPERIRKLEQRAYEKMREYFKKYDIEEEEKYEFRY